MKIRGPDALEAVNFLNASFTPDSSGWTAAVRLDVEREEAERLVVRADLPEELFFEPLEDLPELVLPLFAIISRYSLSL